MQQQQQQQQEQRAPFMLSSEMLDTIMGGLAQLPYRVAAPVIEDIQTQFKELEERAKAEADAQVQAPEVEPETTQAPEAE